MSVKRSITWYPGHMRSALAALRRVIKGVDLVLEVRDSRVPLSSSNPVLSGLLKQKRHIIVLNKSDLVPSRLHKAALTHLQRSGSKVMSASCSTAAGVQQVLHTALDWLQRERAASELSIMMVVGLPNSGKSSLINAFKLSAKKQGLLAGEQAFQKKAKVGLTPGLTRQVAGFQVSAEPDIYMLDTPGIMVPAVPSDEVGYRLALAGAIRDAVVGEEAIVRFMLEFLGRDPQHSLHAIQASGPVGGKRSSRTSRGHTQHAKADNEITRMRTCLHRVLSSSQVLSAPHAQRGDDRGGGIGLPQASLGWVGADGHGLGKSFHVQDSVHAFGDTNLPPWVGRDFSPGYEEDDAEHVLESYEQLMACLGVTGVQNPSKELGMLIRMLRAFREGYFGKFMMDAQDLRL